MVTYESQPVPFYRLVSSNLLQSFDLEPDTAIVQSTWSLHKAVSAIMADKPGSERQPLNHWGHEPLGSDSIVAAIRLFECKSIPL